MGDHWSIAKNLTKQRDDREIHLWICSAGYGLVRPSDKLKPYAVTFSPGQPDSVSSSSMQLGTWWDSLADWKAPGTSSIRSLACAMQTHSSDQWMIALSRPYLAAIHNDLLQGLSLLQSAKQLSIICAGITGLPRLRSNLLPVDERHQEIVGGAKLSLNTRVLRWLLKESVNLDYQSLENFILSSSQDLKEPEKFNRLPFTDSELRQYLRQRLTGTNNLSHTSLLRELRAQGRACEQSRFSREFKSISAEVR